MPRRSLLVNWRLSPSVLKNADSRPKILALVRELTRKGGFEIQSNVVDSGHCARPSPTPISTAT